MGAYSKLQLLSWHPDSPGRGKPAAPYCSVIEEGTHPLSSTQYPVTFYGSPMTKDRAVTDGGQPGNGSGGQKCRGRSPEYHPHWFPWAKLDQTDPTAHLSLESRPTSNRKLVKRPHCQWEPCHSTRSLSCRVSLPCEFNAGSLGWTSKLPYPLVERGKPCASQPSSSPPLLPRQAALHQLGRGGHCRKEKEALPVHWFLPRYP